MSFKVHQISFQGQEKFSPEKLKGKTTIKVGHNQVMGSKSEKATSNRAPYRK
jgi:hypothetical protein